MRAGHAEPSNTEDTEDLGGLYDASQLPPNIDAGTPSSNANTEIHSPNIDAGISSSNIDAEIHLTNANTEIPAPFGNAVPNEVIADIA